MLETEQTLAYTSNKNYFISIRVIFFVNQFSFFLNQPTIRLDLLNHRPNQLPSV
ncbi:hypothetical protein HanPSC8_Chr12g0517821 [Helianthus annuus]|nr:hypothetical protein HanPSC8_Chr12g0517821 [Helianthus annuus]